VFGSAKDLLVMESMRRAAISDCTKHRGFLAGGYRRFCHHRAAVVQRHPADCRQVAVRDSQPAGKCTADQGGGAIA